MMLLLGPLLSPWPNLLKSQIEGIQLTIDLSSHKFPISPDIYGMNDNGGDVDPALAKLIQLPSSRWGGDATTRYNWKIDSTNAGGDWYFMAGSDAKTAVPSKGADAFITRAHQYGGKAILTIPIIDYVDNVIHWDCSFPVSLFGKQQSANPYVHPVIEGKTTDAGNGVLPDGKNIILTEEQILRIHRKNSPEFQAGWVKYLTEKFGPSEKGGVDIYQLDNEPSGWANTHRDIHPVPPLYPEIIQKSLQYAGSIRTVDPNAKILGPGDFGWAVYKGNPGPDGLWNAEKYLKAFKQASDSTYSPLLDYFDEHYYPIEDDGLTAETRDAWRLQSTRSLWDPTYVEKNWIGKYNGTINLIPRMHSWVDKWFPGRKISFTEYSFGALDTMVGALTEADALGIFGREKLDLATLWGPPKITQPGAFAFEMFRNYDGMGAQFGDLGISALSSDPGSVSVYAAVQTKKHLMTVIVINKTITPLNARFKLLNNKNWTCDREFIYSQADLSKIRINSMAALKKNNLLTTEARSITLLEFSQK